jgi:hypothetical protein
MRSTLVRIGVGVAVVALLLVAMQAIAQESGHGRDAAAVGVRDSAPTSAGAARPRLPEDPGRWVGPMLIIIIGMFVAAAVIGPIVRAEAPDEVPVPHGHGEVVGHEDHGVHEPGHHGH